MKDNFAIIDSIRIAAPCNARWEDMTGDEQARFCGSCRKNVYNLSAMTRPEIHALVERTEGKFCGRFYQRTDGRMITADCPEGLRRKRNRIVRACRTAFAAVLLFFGVKTQARAADKEQSVQRLGQVPVAMGKPALLMGDVAAPAIMGRVISPPQTNPPAGATNVPPPAPKGCDADVGTNPPVIMGIVAVPPTPATNATAPKK
jgi:hypothetical protein